MKTFSKTILAVLLGFALTMPVNTQVIYDYGDAPENVVAYPSSGVLGAFPTCKTLGNWIQHTNFGAQLGPSFDFEIDGNGGLCPGFAPYDNDECFQDGDAGLLFPETYTIVSNTVIPCPGFNGTPLGVACMIANWGVDIDIDVSNFMPNQTDGWMNVVIDFNQNGVWGDMVTCPPGPVPEHVLQNFFIPWGYSGPLSGLGPPPFTIGPNSGFVWARFTISEMTVSPNWDGHAFFEDGESEDYLIRVDSAGTGGDQDFGDAPDGVVAYPLTGITGNFPTCANIPATSFVSHYNFGAFFGQMVDFEGEGNAGICPSFTPYNNDECFNDGDAGLLFPDPYTIQGGVVVPCAGSAGTTLGNTCTTVTWGTDIDIQLQNFMPNQTTGYVNVLFDWNMDGDWGDLTNCPGAIAPEHVLHNFAIPNGYQGPLSGLGALTFLTGPNPGYVWARFTISEAMLPLNWDGHGMFEDGESEDYLIYVGTPTAEAEYGDAPEGSIAYPSTSLMGAFPTCIGVGPAGHYVSHLIEELIWFGPTKDFEPDGNAGLCSPYVVPYDNDECFNDGDAGLQIPHPYTIQVTGGVHQVVPCVGTGGILDTICSWVHWGPEVDITVTNLDTIEALVNVLMDFNQDGRWALDTSLHCAGITVPEHVLVNFGVPPGYTGPLSALNPPPFLAGPNAGYIWTRFTVSEHHVLLDWNGVYNFDKGESEDYLLKLDLPDAVGEAAGPELNLQIFPNPTNNSVTITYELRSPADVNIEVYDVRGSMISIVADEQQYTGSQSVRWDGNNSTGQAVGSGIYIVKISLNNMPVEREKVLMIK